jgi:hypothetical protein
MELFVRRRFVDQRAEVAQVVAEALEHFHSFVGQINDREERLNREAAVGRIARVV